MKYKYDFHCHVKEGSRDSKVSSKEFIESLINQGFSGMLVTDHDTYKGYQYIKEKLKYDNFIVLKGIELSVLDAGHILVIMPDDYNLEYIKYKSHSLRRIINSVHNQNGILGPAHPFSEPYLSIFNSRKYRCNYDICKEFDFMEVFNAGEKEEENKKALELAKKYNLFFTAGSDSHYKENCGKSYIELDERITTNNQLIEYIKNHKPVAIGGSHYVNLDRKTGDRFGSLVYYAYHLYKNHFK